MEKQLSTGAKYLLQLAQTASINDFIKEAHDFFVSADVQRDLFTRDNHSNPKKYALAPAYQNLAEEFGKTPLIEKLDKLSWADTIRIMYELPIFWGLVPMKRFREKIAKLSGNAEQVIVTLIKKIESNPSRKEGWQEVFWDSFFANMFQAAELNEHTSLITKLTWNYETLLCSTKDKAIIYGLPQSYRIFLNAFAKVVVKSAESLSNADTFLEQVCSMVQFHPVFCKFILYPNTNKVSVYLLNAMQRGFEKRLAGHGFMSWPMFEVAYEAITFTMFCGERCKNLSEVSEYVASVIAFGEQLEKLNAQNRFSDEKYCTISGESTCYHQRSAEKFTTEVLKSYWRNFVITNPISENNLKEVVALQAKYYSPEWNKQFEKVTENNFKLCFDYISQMAFARKNDTWDREEVIKYITASDVWKSYPIKTVIDQYYKYRSIVMYESILQRPAAELPDDWMREKHLYQLCNSKFAKGTHTHDRIYR